MKAAIVVLNYNGLDDTLACLRSLEALLDREQALLIVVDNASAVDPRPTLTTLFPCVQVLRLSRNTGWSGGNNAGIRCALDHGIDAVLLLNNDVVVAPNLLQRLTSAALAEPTYGIIGPIIRYMDEPDVTMTDGVLFNRPGYPGFFQRCPVTVCCQDPPRVQEVDIVNGCAMFIRREVFEAIGQIDDRFFLIHEEADFCLRAQDAGWRCGILSEPLVWHKGSSSFKRSGRRWQRYYDTRNLALLLFKHTARPGSERRGSSAYAHYLRYAYHRYCHEREANQEESADAVLEGLIDAAARRFGPYHPRPRRALPFLRFLFEAARRWVSAPPSDLPPADARRDLWRSQEKP